jgi:hypothetical protein
VDAAGSLFQPKIHRPMNVASKKNAMRPSKARGAEHVADEAAVARPVHAELELLHDAGDDAHREVDQEDLPEEARQVQPLHVAGAVPDRLEDRDEQRHAERERHEDEVVQGRQAELPACEQERVRKSIVILPRAGVFFVTEATQGFPSPGALGREKEPRSDQAVAPANISWTTHSRGSHEGRMPSTARGPPAALSTLCMRPRCTRHSTSRCSAWGRRVRRGEVDGQLALIDERIEAGVDRGPRRARRPDGGRRCRARAAPGSTRRMIAPLGGGAHLAALDGAGRWTPSAAL